MKSSFFSFSRFRDVFALYMRSDLRQYLLWLLSCLGILMLLVFWLSYEYYSHCSPYTSFDQAKMVIWPMFSVALVIICAVSSARVMKMLKTKSSRISTLMLPASEFEKFSASFLIVTIVTPIIFLIGLTGIDLLRCWVYSMLYPDLSEFIKPIIYDSVSPQSFWSYTAFVVAVQSVFALGGVIWPKNPTIKTFVAVFIITNVIGIIGMTCATQLLRPDMSYGFDFDPTIVIEDCPFLFFFVPACIFALINYTIAYFRFREIEIIQRW